MDTTGWWVRVSSAPVGVRVLTRPHAVAHFAVSRRLNCCCLHSDLAKVPCNGAVPVAIAYGDLLS